MRLAPTIALFVLGFAAFAKDPAPASSRSRSEDVLGKPDLEKAFNVDQSSSFGRSGSTFRTKSANSNSFYFQQKYNPKGYDTKSFSTKSAWDGDFKFATKDARTKSFETKEAPTKTAPVKEARDAGKTASTREFIPGNREAVLTGRSQALFDSEGPAGQNKIGPAWSGNLKNLSIGEVREILNKNK